MENAMQEQSASLKPRTSWRPRKDRCLFQDANGLWHIDYYTPDGKRRRKLVGKVKKEAQVLLAKIRVGMSRGEYVDAASAPGFSEFVGIFMERHGQHKPYYNKSAGTLNKLKGFFGRIKVSKIAPGHIERYRIHRLQDEKSKRNPEGPVSLTTVDAEVGIVRAMLGKAVKWGYLAKNPAGQVEDYNQDNRRKRFLSSDEIRHLLRSTKRTTSPLLRPAVYLALQTGMRKGELLGLRWQDINFEARQILLRKTKSNDPRHVPMNRRALWLLKKLAARAPLSEWVFESEKRDGAKAAASDIKTAWRRALRLARIEDFRFHDLRHTFASHFAMNRGDLYALADILGHSNPKITIDRYAHLSPEYVQAQRGVMDRMYSSSAVPVRNGRFMDTEPAEERTDAM